MPAIETTPELVQRVYDKLTRNVEIARKRLGRPLTYAEKVFLGHLHADPPRHHAAGRGGGVDHRRYDGDRGAVRVRQALARDARRRRARSQHVPRRSAREATSQAAREPVRSATRCTTPRRSASSASMRFAKRMSSFAAASPIRRVSRCVPPAPGMIARPTSVSPTRAWDAITRKSQHSAISSPPPSAMPLIAATTGFGSLSRNDSSVR